MRRIPVRDPQDAVAAVIKFDPTEVPGCHGDTRRRWQVHTIYDDHWWAASSFVLCEDEPYLFLFADGTTGVAGEDRIDAALLTHNLRRR